MAVEMSELSVEAPLLVGVDALLDVFLAFGHHEVDQAGEFAGGRLYGHEFRAGSVAHRTRVL